MPGHFICSFDCVYHAHTHIDGYCISTIGGYMPFHKRNNETVHGIDYWEEVGHQRKFETMVFKLGKDNKYPESWTELDMNGYNTYEEADKGHLAMIEKWEDK